MDRRSWMWCILSGVCLFGAGILVSCGGSDGPTDSGTAGEPPSLSFPQVNVNTNIDRSTESGDDAYSILYGEVFFANSLAGAGSYFSPYVAVQWGAKSGDCWSWSGSVGGCTITYQLCSDEAADTASWLWRTREEGACGSTDTAVSWVSSEARTDADGDVGSIVMFQTYLSVPQAVCRWDFAADRKSGSWTYESGPGLADTLAHRVSWIENADSSLDVSWEITSAPDERWIARVPKDRRSGHLLSYDWDAGLSDYYLQLDMTWQSDGSGVLTRYDEGGRAVEMKNWP